MSEDNTIEVFINPLQILEVDEPWSSLSEGPVKPDDIFKFMCTPGVSSDIESLTKRYKKISQENPRLFVAPRDQRILEKVIWPLRHAKASYIVGNFLSTIALCGIVSEMISIFLFEISEIATIKIKTKEGGKIVSSGSFEKMGQETRIKTLFDNNIIDGELKSKFDHIRYTRRRYLHLWSHDHDSLPRDASSVFHATVYGVVKSFGQEFDQGKLILKPNFIKYLAKTGTVQLEE